ncbi:MAG: glycosyltransferase family 2 protein, partial [Candidatus Levyibacteriota bacterium]
MTRARRSSRIDILVDARAPADRLRRCVEALLAQPRGDFRLLLVDAAPQDRAPGALVEALARRGVHGIAVLPGEVEPGFAAAANRALAESDRDSDGDVVLVDSAMIATPGWLDALARCAASDSRIATAVPFSNAGALCSFPRLLGDDPWFADRDPGPTLAALAGAAVPTYPDPPIGTGPCLYLRRRALRVLGGLDPAFVTLQGAQADFCMRALRAHWRNTLADDAFVVHGEAPAGSHDPAEARDQARLARRHPYLAEVVGAFVTIDPLRPLREAALSRMLVAGSTPGVLHVIHDHGGGVETHVRALIEASRAGWRHCVATAVGDRWQVDEYLGDGATRRFELVRGDGESWHDFVGGIATSFRI